MVRLCSSSYSVASHRDRRCADHLAGLPRSPDRRPSEGSYRGLYLGFTFALLAITLAAGIVSFRNWRRISNERSIAESEGRGRKEYMALAGVFISITLGIGIVWLSIPIFVLNICARQR